MCFGFLGIQFGFALQNANVSRIFQTLGAEDSEIAGLWLAAPLTGLLVQPIVGYFSDRTWTRLGRRGPYFLFGALATSIALVFMPHSPELWIAAGMLWILDASINVSMEPFRAFVGDQLPVEQQSTGYVMQSFFIGVGAVVASCLPFLFEKYGVANTAAIGVVPDTVRYSFYVGAVVLLCAVGWTVISSKEYPPEVFASFHAHKPKRELGQWNKPSTSEAMIWLSAGVLIIALIMWFKGRNQLYVFGGSVLLFGVAQFVYRRLQTRNMFTEIMHDLRSMPETMRKLAVVQFFSWVALFCMWLYCTPAVTQRFYATLAVDADAYNSGANWVGVLMGAYNGFAALAAIGIAPLANRIGLGKTHMLCLFAGAAGFASFLIVPTPQLLMVSMIGVGIAWASILSIPYALLADSLPPEKMGVYMGIFNFFIVVPQVLAASVLGTILEGHAPIYAFLIGAVCFVIAGFLVLAVRERSVSELR